MGIVTVVLLVLTGVLGACACLPACVHPVCVFEAAAAPAAPMSPHSHRRAPLLLLLLLPPRAGWSGLLFLSLASGLLCGTNVALVALLRHQCRGGQPHSIEPSSRRASLIPMPAAVCIVLCCGGVGVESGGRAVAACGCLCVPRAVHAVLCTHTSVPLTGPHPACLPARPPARTPTRHRLLQWWWLSPSVLLCVPIRLTLFLCSFVFSTTVFFAWQFGSDSCLFHPQADLWHIG